MIEVINKKNILLQFSGYEIGPLSSIFFEEEEWKSVYNADKYVRELLSIGYIELKKE